MKLNRTEGGIYHDPRHNTVLSIDELKNALDGDEVFEVWITAGQSNATGSGGTMYDYLEPGTATTVPTATVAGGTVNYSTTPGLEAPQDGIYMVGSSGQVSRAIPPLHHNSNVVSASPEGGVSIAYEFAKRRRAQGAKVIALAAGEAGSRLHGSVWQPSANGGTGENYDLVISRVNAMLASGIKCWIRGVLWHQGESDASNSITKTQYKDAFLQMINGWKAGFNNDYFGSHDNLQVIIGGLSGKLLTEGYDSGTGTVVTTTQYGVIDSAHKELAAENRGFAFVNMADAINLKDDTGNGSTPNDIHFSIQQIVDMSDRMHNAVIESAFSMKGPGDSSTGITVWSAQVQYERGNRIYEPVSKKLAIATADLPTAGSFIPGEWYIVDLTPLLVKEEGGMRVGVNLGFWDDGNITGYAYKNWSKVMRPFSTTAAFGSAPTLGANGSVTIPASSGTTTFLLDNLADGGIDSDSSGDGTLTEYLENGVCPSVIEAGVYIVEATLGSNAEDLTLNPTGIGASAGSATYYTNADGEYIARIELTLTDPVDISTTTSSTNRLNLTWSTTAGCTISDLVIVKEGWEAGWKTNPWDERFLDLLAPFDFIRFMQPQKINDQEADDITGVSERPDFADISWQQSGLPARAAYDLCNRVGADAWMCTPHKVYNDPDYAAAEVADILAYLAPNLRVISEYTSEWWNGSSGGGIGQQQPYISNTIAVSVLGLTTSAADQRAAYVYAQVQFWQHLETAFGSREAMAERVIRMGTTQHAGSDDGAGTFSAGNVFGADTVLDQTISDATVLDFRGKSTLRYKEECDAFATAPYFPGIPFYDYDDRTTDSGLSGTVDAPNSSASGGIGLNGSLPAGIFGGIAIDSSAGDGEENNLFLCAKNQSGTLHATVESGAGLNTPWNVEAYLDSIYTGKRKDTGADYSAFLLSPNKRTLRTELELCILRIQATRQAIDSVAPGMPYWTYEGGFQIETSINTTGSYNGYSYNSSTFTNTDQMEAMAMIASDPRGTAYLGTLLDEFANLSGAGGGFCNYWLFGLLGAPTNSFSPVGFYGVLRHWGEDIRSAVLNGDDSDGTYQGTERWKALAARSRKGRAFGIRSREIAEPEKGLDIPSSSAGNVEYQVERRNIVVGSTSDDSRLPGRTYRVPVQRFGASAVPEIQPLIDLRNYYDYFPSGESKLGSAEAFRFSMVSGTIDRLDFGGATPGFSTSLAGLELQGTYIGCVTDGDGVQKANAFLFFGRDNAGGSATGVASATGASLRVREDDGAAASFTTALSSSGDLAAQMTVIPVGTGTAGTSYLAAELLQLNTRARFGVSIYDSAAAEYLWGVGVNLSGASGETRLQGQNKVKITARPVTGSATIADTASATLEVNDTRAEGFKFYQEEASGAESNVAGIQYDGTRWVFYMLRSGSTTVYDALYFNAGAVTAISGYTPT